MLNGIAVFNASAARMTHSAMRHKLLTSNVANAETPGYVGRDLTPFTITELPQAMQATRPGHLNAGVLDDPYAAGREAIFSQSREETLNHNKINVEAELAKAAEAQNSHDMAAAVWQKSLDLLRTSLGKA